MQARPDPSPHCWSSLSASRLEPGGPPEPLQLVLVSGGLLRAALRELHLIAVVQVVQVLQLLVVADVEGLLRVPAQNQTPKLRLN